MAFLKFDADKRFRKFWSKNTMERKVRVEVGKVEAFKVQVAERTSSGNRPAITVLSAVPKCPLLKIKVLFRHLDVKEKNMSRAKCQARMIDAIGNNE
ncbi:hypothetical protein AVEN_141471-1 [Araneus ventricosus]|uniref:Uncharacterized protein n=1 Tax=Araneus ventricosus TaxID=182803 RepID=A0A4Y2SXB6_ARAVE|nr:hypothetical protein AVEN_141471-1 [Araneus ventricosus]